MSDFTPPYDFPRASPSIGERIENIVDMMRLWLRLHPQWVPLIERIVRLADR